MALLKALLALGALLVGVLLAGALLLSPHYQVSRSVLIKAPAERVFAHLDSPAGWARWGVWYRKDPQMKVTPEGSAQGVGAAWSWTSKSEGNGRMKLTAVEAGKRVGYELQIEDFNPSTGQLELVPEAGGTRVTWTMQGDVGHRLARWFAFFMDRLVGPDFEAGLANLKQLAEKQ
ncbi:SRPBCC family protein [Inhella proteolytica]|uniref:SRPBCC family protein n=1 Tax=Inhella proteolytica TaxID=2795029 RepID=A0A931J368_9BURK|nr:SRPBCC family protein [Inhella proteolytica]MBH9576072.1 SRPBCC family protein [Inhella proteolytica]